MKKFGDIRDSMPPACPVTGYDCGKAECGKDHATCVEPKPNSGEKIWGSTTPLIVTPMFEMHRLLIKPMHRCSFHHHRFKHNAFYVIDGTLYIDSDEGVRTTRLWRNQHHTVEPGVKHQFRTGPDPCIALEMYYTEPLSEDIIRANVGSAL